MNSYDDCNDYNGDNFDKFLNEIADSMSSYLQLRRRLLDAEVKLEALISADLVEILTDADGNFTYRMTKAGVDSYREQLGIEPNNRDISFMEFARISQ